jgi:aryl-alcohol dehydrogenase-like predicted oxidoreductase
MRVPDRKSRRRLLEVTFERGIRHFDVARLYGLGAAEQELGEFIRTRRNQVIVATKFGIESQRAIGYLASLQSPVRWLFKKFPSVRAMAARRVVQQSSGPKRFTPESARMSLETSLRKLRSDYVDFFFLHEPTEQDWVSDDLSQCLEDLKKEGKIRAFGISVAASDLMPVVRKHPALVPVIQFDNDAVSRQIDALNLPSHTGLLTFAPLSSALPAVEELCVRSPTLIKTIATETGIDLHHHAQRIQFLVTYALQANPRGTVVFASTNESHIAEISGYADDTSLMAGAIRATVEKISSAPLALAAAAGHT